MRLRSTILRAQKLQMGTQDVHEAYRHSSACENHEDNGSVTMKRIQGTSHQKSSEPSQALKNSILLLTVSIGLAKKDCSGFSI